MVSPRTQATLLLTAHIAPASMEDLRPLDVREWNKLARWLKALDLTPEDLVHGDACSILSDWKDLKTGRDRLLQLLDRGAALAASVDRWGNYGLWILGRSDPEYPQRIKDHLKDSAPPLLFGRGNERQLGDRGIAIVGSRDADIEDLNLASRLGSMVSRASLNVISGGARGVDEWAAYGAFFENGTVIAVLADSLVRNVTKRQYRTHLEQERLVLTTPYSPETGFSSGNAMGRNRLIYCLADAAIAVSSTNGSGGTFGGATINLENQWTPLWVKENRDPVSGNATLVDKGAGLLPPVWALSIDSLLKSPGSEDKVWDRHYPERKELGGDSSPIVDTTMSLYDIFVEKWRRLDTDPITPEDLADALGLTQTQAQEWLNRSVNEGVSRKLAKPVRFTLLKSVTT